MANCRDIESKLAEYVDREQPAEARLAIEAHLQACPPCRARALGEQAAHDLVLRPARRPPRLRSRGAPPALRRRNDRGRTVPGTS